MRHLPALALLLCAAAAVAQTVPQGGGVIGPLRRGPDGKIIPAPPAPAEAGRTKQAGSDIAEAIAAARDGDTIEIRAGVYRTTFAVQASRVTIRGVGGRPHIDCAGMRPIGDKACVLLVGNEVRLENLEISGAAVSADIGAGAACIRNEPGRSFTLRGIVCRSSQNGVLADGGTILVEGSEFFDNGWSARTQNAGFSGDCSDLTVRNSTFRDARVGDELKSRCRKTLITDSSFRSQRGARSIDVAEGGETLLSNVLIVRSRFVAEGDVIAFAGERCKNPAPMRILRSRIVNEHPQASITNHGKCEGQPITLEGVTFEGVRPTLRGYVQAK